MSWRCKLGFHDWQPVGAAREDVCEVIARGKKPGRFQTSYFGVITVMEGLEEDQSSRPACEYTGMKWFEDRVCLRCRCRDNQIEREVERVKAQMVERDRREAELNRILGQMRG